MNLGHTSRISGLWARIVRAQRTWGRRGLMSRTPVGGRTGYACHERTPMTLAVRAGRPITTTLWSDNTS